MSELAEAGSWLALVVGNSRLHWAYFVGSDLQLSWDLPHLPEAAIATLVSSRFDFTPHLSTSLQPDIEPSAKLWVASVVPAQTQLWQTYCSVHEIMLDQVPITGFYSTLGIDRALALLGAVQQWGYPVLVVDAGTALTLTGANQAQQFVGGAILPGLGLQLRSLFEDTAALPQVELQAEAGLPQRWAMNTPEAIRSGIIYSLLAGLKAFIEAWQEDFPESAIAFTGGDSHFLLNRMAMLYPRLMSHVCIEPHLIFRGIQAVKHGLSAQ
jgi:type III pantothenate kinase